MATLSSSGVMTPTLLAVLVDLAETPAVSLQWARGRGNGSWTMLRWDAALATCPDHMGMTSKVVIVASEGLRMPAEITGRWQQVPRIWRGALIRMAVVWLALFAVFFPDWAAMSRQWWDISTYNHIVLVPLILIWLVAQRAAPLGKLVPQAWWPGIFAVLAAGFVWLLGAISGLDIARQAGAVGLLAASVPLLLGPRVTAGLFFPLCYMLFLVPAGEEMVSVLQTITARITIVLTHASGVPAVIEGVFINTPAGLFEVAEACSGIKFLIAMIAFGVLAANVCFVSWPRRILMIIACVVVPVIANGIRAWGTIYAAQIFGIKVAAGFDHIIYGWVFFALVLTFVIVTAWRFFDRPVDAPMIDAAAINHQPMLARLSRLRMSSVAAMVSLALVIAGYQGWAAFADRLTAPVPAQIDLPQVPGWTRVSYNPTLWWEPRAQGSDHRLIGSYGDGRGHRVDVFLAVYASQGEGREAGGFGQGALPPSSVWAWQSDAPDIDGANGEQLLGGGRVERVAQTWYRTGTLMSGSNLRLKLAVIADHILLRPRTTSLLIISAENMPGQDGLQAIAAFRHDAGPLGQWVDRIVALR